MPKKCVPIDPNCYSSAFLSALRALQDRRGNHLSVKKELILDAMKDERQRLQAQADDDEKIQDLVYKGVLTVTKAGRFSIARNYWV